VPVGLSIARLLQEHTVLQNSRRQQKHAESMLSSKDSAAKQVFPAQPFQEHINILQRTAQKAAQGQTQLLIDQHIHHGCSAQPGGTMQETWSGPDAGAMAPAGCSLRRRARWMPLVQLLQGSKHSRKGRHTWYSLTFRAPSSCAAAPASFLSLTSWSMTGWVLCRLKNCRKPSSLLPCDAMSCSAC
jgi:hypothetical protein